MDTQPEDPTNTQSPQQDNPANPVAAATPAPAAASSLPGTPDAWPGAFGAYKYSREAVRVNLLTLVIIFVLIGLVTSILQSKAGMPGQILAFVVESFAAAAFVLIYIAGVRRKKLSIGESFTEALPFTLKMMGLKILVTLSIIGGLLLLIVPGLIILSRLILADYFLVDKKLGVIEAYKASWNASKGYGLKVWGIIGVAILMILPVLTIIGIPVTIYLLVMYSAAFAVFYEFLNKKGLAPATAAPSQAAASAASETDVTPPKEDAPATDTTVSIADESENEPKPPTTNPTVD